LFFAPATFDALWSWPLTPLTGRAIGAWLIGYSLLVGQVIRENDRRRVRAPLLSYALWAVLQLVALARYADTPDWDSPTAWVFLAFILSVLLVATYGAAESWRGRRSPVTVEPAPAGPAP
jgi:hypothetical protein